MCRSLVIVGSIALASVIAGSALAQTRQAYPGDPRADTMLRLEKKVSVDLRESRLEDALKFVEQVGDLTLEPMWLEGAASRGLEKDKPVTLSVKSLDLLTLLERILEKAETIPGENAWQLTPSGMIEVGPKERLNARQTLKIYDIQDLTFVVPDFPDVPELDLDTVLQQTTQRGGQGGGGGIFTQSATRDIENDETDRAQQVIDLILANVEPEQWRENGGDGGSITLHNGALLVRAPDYIHRQIGGYPFAPGGRAPAPLARRYVSIDSQMQAATPAGESTQPVTGAAGNNGTNP